MWKARGKCVQRGENRSRSINGIDGFLCQNLLTLPNRFFCYEYVKENKGVNKIEAKIKDFNKVQICKKKTSGYSGAEMYSIWKSDLIQV